MIKTRDDDTLEVYFDAGYSKGVEHACELVKAELVVLVHALPVLLVQGDVANVANLVLEVAKSLDAFKEQFQ